MSEKHHVIRELLQEEKRTRTDGPQALLKKVDLDHLLDFVHGEKVG
jgi:putative sterol carrier protein